MVVICLNMDEDRSSIKRVLERLYAYSVLDILEMTYLGPVNLRQPVARTLHTGIGTLLMPLHLHLQPTHVGSEPKKN
jgi:hypothetical protein